MSKPHEALVRAMAEAAVERTVGRAVRALKKVPAGLLGEDSGLAHAWDEYCAQVQYQHAVFWDAYEITVQQCAAGALRGLSNLELCAIWLQSDDGMAWADEHDGDHGLPPFSEDDVRRYICAALQRRADAESSPRLREYLDRFHEHE